MNSAELELLDAIIQHDRKAMGDLYEQYLPRLWRFLYGITQDVDMTQELTNDVMLAVWQNAAGFRRESTVSTWILGIAYRQALDAMRSRRRYEDKVKQMPPPPFTGQEVAHLMVDRDLNTLMSKLSTEQRAVAELSFDFGYSYPEIADILHIPVNTVKTRMYYARQTMQVAYERASRRER